MTTEALEAKERVQKWIVAPRFRSCQFKLLDELTAHLARGLHREGRECADSCKKRAQAALGLRFGR